VRALVERHRDEPFTFLGMYGREGDPREVAQRMKAEDITWRNAMVLGEIEAQPLWSTWAVRGFPQFYLLDAQGVIRGRWFGDPGSELETSIGALLAELRTTK
jgi:hypothetical protein